MVGQNLLSYILVIALFMSGTTYAACSPSAGNAVNNISGNITVPRNLATGQPVGKVYGPFSGSGGSLGSCGFIPYMFLTFNTAQGQSSFTDVYQTNIPGIGFKAWTTFLSKTYIGNKPVYWYRHNSTGGSAYITSIYIQFYKISDNVGAGKILFSSPLIRANTSSNGNTADGLPYDYLGLASSITVIPEKGCSVVNYDKTVTLSDVKKNDLIKNIGRYENGSAFNIKLDCTSDTKVSVNFDGTAMSGHNDVLDNSSSGADSAGKAVGIQLVYNDAPISLNQKMNVIDNSLSQQDLVFKAHYYFNGNSEIKNGIVTAVTTFTFTYQ